MRDNERIKVGLIQAKATGKVDVNVPMSLLVLADFGKDDGKSHLINKSNFDAVLGSIAPRVKVNLAGKYEDICIKSIKDFSPDYIAYKSKSISNLIGLRNLIRVLNARVKNNKIDLNQVA